MSTKKDKVKGKYLRKLFADPPGFFKKPRKKPECKKPLKHIPERWVCPRGPRKKKTSAAVAGMKAILKAKKFVKRWKAKTRASRKERQARIAERNALLLADDPNATPEYDYANDYA